MKYDPLPWCIRLSCENYSTSWRCRTWDAAMLVAHRSVQELGGRARVFRVVR